MDCRLDLSAGECISNPPYEVHESVDDGSAENPGVGSGGWDTRKTVAVHKRKRRIEHNVTVSKFTFDKAHDICVVTDVLEAPQCVERTAF